MSRLLREINSIHGRVLRAVEFRSKKKAFAFMSQTVFRIEKIMYDVNIAILC